MKAQPHGWLVLDKPRGLGSTQAVSAVKRNLRAAGYGKVKVGHGGTLDPLAEGVLPIAMGEATKLAGRMLDSDKAYAFTIRFGEQTDTLDTEGPVVAESNVRPTLAQVQAVLPGFTGPIEQVPPAYSALKVDGQRAYDLARAGEEVVLKTRAVVVHDLTIDQAALDSHLRGIDDPDPPDLRHSRQGGNPADIPTAESAVESITLVAHVSKGTYIRSLARDIALALGTVGYVTYLRRIKAGPFTPQQAISLDMLNEIGNGAPLEDHLLPLEAGLDGIPALMLSPDDAQAARQGRIISGLPHADGLHLALTGTVPVALMELSAGTAKVVRGFNLPDTAE